MHWKLFRIPVLFVMSALMIGPLFGVINWDKVPKALAEGEILLGDSNCGDTLSTEGGVYILQEDMTCSGDGLVIGANQITIDGAGHKLRGSGGSDGISNTAGYDYLTVRNFNSSGGIENFSNGINNYNASNLNITSNIILQNFSYGISVDEDKDIQTDCDGEGCWDTYLTTGNSSNSTISNNTFIKNVATALKIAGTNIAVENNLFAFTNGSSTQGCVYGTTLTNSSINNNKFLANFQPVKLSFNSSNNIFSSNTLLGNRYSNIVYSDNSPANSTVNNNNLINNFDDDAFITNSVSQTNKILEEGETAQIQFSLQNYDQTACALEGAGANCSYDIDIYPTETMQAPTITDNTVTSSFAPSRLGAYSVVLKYEDKDGNSIEQSYRYFVGGMTTATKKYYLNFQQGLNGQPYAGRHRDTGVLNSDAPSVSDWLNCTDWEQLSPDELPNFPLAAITGGKYNGWYADYSNGLFYALSPKGDYLGDGSPEGEQHYSELLPTTTNFNLGSADPSDWPHDAVQWIDNINFGDSFEYVFDRANSWYWLVVDQYQGHYWLNFPEWDSSKKSNVDLNYKYPSNAPVKTISNPYINILESTTSSNSDNVSLTLDGETLSLFSYPGSSLNTDVTLTNLNKAFLGYTTVISSDNEATLKATNIVNKTTVNTSNLSIIPDTGSIEVTISSWNTSGDYLKQWTETGTDVTSAAHTVGDLKANTYYNVVTSGWSTTKKSNSSGEITFNYDGGYSSKTFAVSEDTDVPSIIINDPASGSASTTAATYIIKGTIEDVGSGLDFATINNISINNPSNFSVTVNLSIGANSFMIEAQDNAGNVARTPINITRTAIPVAPSSDTSSSIRNVLPRSFQPLSETSLSIPSTVESVEAAASEEEQTRTSTNDFSIYDGSNYQSLDINSNITTYTGRPIFKGKTVPNAKVVLEIHSNEAIIAETSSDINGNWEYQVDRDLSIGSHTLKVTIKDNSNRVLSENTYSFSVEKTGEQRGRNWIYYVLGAIAALCLAMFIIRRKSLASKA